jgi:hypothetical protein
MAADCKGWDSDIIKNGERVFVMHNTEFSIIIIVYNQEKYLAECIDSVLQQTYEAKEIIIIDDGSTDNSTDICLKYRDENPNKIFFFRQQNSGAFVARTEGMKRAKGNYMLVIDSDDKLSENALEILNRDLQEERYDMIIFNASRHKSLETKFFDFTKLNVEDGVIKDKKCLYDAMCCSDDYNTMWSKCINTTLINKYEVGLYGKGIYKGEDRIHSLYFINKADRIKIEDTPIYYYRKNYHSMTKTFIHETIYHPKLLHEVLLKYAREWYGEELALAKCREKLALDSYFEAKSIIRLCNSWKVAKQLLTIIIQDKEYVQSIYEYGKNHKRDMFFKSISNNNLKLLQLQFYFYKLRNQLKKIGIVIGIL